MSSFHHCVFLVFVCCVLYLMGCGCAVVVKCRLTRVTASGLNIFAFIIFSRWSSVDSKHSESGRSFAERCFSLRRDAEESLLAGSGQVGPGSWCADAAVGIGNQRDCAATVSQLDAPKLLVNSTRTVTSPRPIIAMRPASRLLGGGRVLRHAVALTLMVFMPESRFIARAGRNVAPEYWPGEGLPSGRRSGKARWSRTPKRQP